MGGSMNRRAVYPGTFDPVTNGHMDVIQRAINTFDEIIIAVALSEAKKPTFSLDERIQMLRLAIDNTKVGEVKITIVPFDGLLATFAKTNDANTIIRGLRAISDFEFELQMGYTNSSLNPALNTIYFMSDINHSFISSTVVREILKYGGNVSHLIPPPVLSFIYNNKRSACI